MKIVSQFNSYLPIILGTPELSKYLHNSAKKNLHQLDKNLRSDAPEIAII